MKNLKWTPLEHQLKKQLTQRGLWIALSGQHLLLAVSGGADSVAALIFATRFQKILKLKITVLHLHHGKGKNLKYRNQTKKFVTQLCKSLHVDIVVKRHMGAELKSEDQMRDYRQSQYADVLTKMGADFLVTGHHANDLLETRVMRLIRGTGLQGLKSMDVIDHREFGSIFRPFLQQSHEEILQYLKDLKQEYIEDPSNADTRFFRNWIRHKWLAELETKVPGSVASLGRSLALISNSTETTSLSQDIWTSKGISRVQFSILSQERKKSVLAEYLKRLKKRHFRHTQIEEITKLLDKSQIEHKFMMLGLCWVVNAEQITVEF